MSPIADRTDSSLPGGRGHAVVLITASWCAPARPAPTILRELSARWGDSLTAVHVADPDDDILTALRITSLPTWLLFRPSHEASSTGVPRPTATLPGGTTSENDERADRGALPGDLDLSDSAASWPASLRRLQRERWVETHRRTGALPKHIIDTEFGPSASAGHSENGSP